MAEAQRDPSQPSLSEGPAEARSTEDRPAQGPTVWIETLRS